MLLTLLARAKVFHDIALIHLTPFIIHTIERTNLYGGHIHTHIHNSISLLQRKITKIESESSQLYMHNRYNTPSIYHQPS
ncbi:hypothetical protein QVD17_33386 [Tagetes erecta]|uniref:Uncharacterized protein n=1 Tax=Tagetes erecta TaxID=13708 RepID=A0AAD8K0X4_TARER|nr:hypothetical protein QVD17_33386 [Tagetes erecta]